MPDIEPTPNIGPENHVSASNVFPNRTNYSWRCEAWLNWQSGTRVSLHIELHVDGSGSTYSGYDKSNWDIYVQGAHVYHWGPGKFDFRSGSTRAILYWDMETNVYNDGRIDVDTYAAYDILGSTNALVDVYGTPPRVPDAPTMNQPTEVTTTGMKTTFNGHGDGGSPITSWTLQRATDQNFTQNVDTRGSNGTDVHTGLTPGTTYYFRAYGTNAIGNSAWSNVVSQQTLPAVPPGLVVAATPSGTAAKLTFSPPNGMTGVTKYTWERRLNGTTSPVATDESTVIETTVSGLTPGSSYDWRASAWFGTYQTPWSTWQTLKQPKPNIDAGDYFDGDTVDILDIDYGWTGTPGGSTSTGVAQVPQGWGATFASNMKGALYRVTAGIFSTYAARLQIQTDATAPGQIHVGQAWDIAYMTEVTEDATYIGSIHVRSSRSQNLAATILWLRADGSFISGVNGAATNVPGGTWLRLAVGGIAPAGAQGAVIRAIDVAGTGWSAWQGGDTIDLDGAMISLNEEFPYFDGATTSDGTYIYEWEDPELPHASISRRTPIALASRSALAAIEGQFRPAYLALVDPDCAVVPPPPRPPSIPSDCIEDVGVWRRYYATIPSNYVPIWADLVPTTQIISGSSAARQVRIRYHANPGDLLPEQVPDTEWIAEQIISFMPALTAMTIDGVTQRVWAEIQSGDPIGADHLLYGTNGEPPTWPILSCGVGYLITVDVPISEPAGNVSINTALTARF